MNANSVRPLAISMLIVIVGSTRAAAAPDRMGEVDPVVEVSRLEFAIVPNDIVVSGSLAYVADDELGLRVVDVSDPAMPFETGSVTTSVGNRVAMIGTTAYLAVGDFSTQGGLRIIDASNPAAPVEIGGLDTDTEAQGVDVAGDIAYLAAGSTGLLIIDVADESSPALLGIGDTVGEAFAVEVVGTVAYVGDAGFGQLHGLRVFDVSDPELPAEIASLDTGDEIRDIVVNGNLAYLAVNSLGLLVVDVSNPAKPIEIGSLVTPNLARGLSVAGDFAFVADFNTGLVVLDVSDPESPTQLAALDTGVANNVDVVSERAYVADSFSGLRIIDVSNLAAPSMLGGTDLPSPSELALSGSIAYVADGNLGLRVIDVAVPMAPNELVRTNVPATPGEGPNGIFIEDDRAYFRVNFSDIEILDVTNPAGPISLGGFPSGDSVSDLAAAGKMVYLASRFELKIFDTNDPAAVVALGTVPLPGSAQTVEVAGDYAFVGYGANSTPGFDRAGLLVVDVSNPDFPMEVANIDLTGNSPREGSIEGLELAGDLAYAAVWPSRLILFDVSDPTQPFELGRAEDFVTSSRHIAVAGTFAYVHKSVVDVSSPEQPIDLGPFFIQGIFDVEADDNFIYVADDLAGLRIFQLTDSDADGVADVADNCTTFANTDQRDTDGDGIGNACDPDHNQDCVVNFLDLGLFLPEFFGNPPNPAFDYNADGFINFIDLGRMKQLFFSSAAPGPGPSGVSNICEED